ncbi:MAG TPA: hypothetical protein DCZ01_12665 [Elusimicrobia bacterium]|nr:MAG: hypothetical protein A2X37_09065 [Elusimicrobia bacterium GWA2_66_18]OGR71131.1 MAG: hypothetical protein A2X40_06915 [Elusimicrobia bacterium GWC2_65_9]HAZ09339.1 hypothetical protein [Elusimicrobiota bacterium]
MKSTVKNAVNLLKGSASAAETRPTLDYPRQDETISYLYYTLRVCAPETAESVDISINQGPWLACRKAAGFWWHDWSGYDNGEYEVIARTPGKNGRWLMGIPHEFMVKLAP